MLVSFFFFVFFMSIFYRTSLESIPQEAIWRFCIFYFYFLSLVAYVVVMLWKSRREAARLTSSSQGSKVPLKRLASLCLVYTFVAFPLSIYYMYTLIKGGGYVPYRLKTIQSTVSILSLSLPLFGPTRVVNLVHLRFLISCSSGWLGSIQTWTNLPYIQRYPRHHGWTSLCWILYVFERVTIEL